MRPLPIHCLVFGCQNIPYYIIKFTYNFIVLLEAHFKPFLFPQIQIIISAICSILKQLLFLFKPLILAKKKLKLHKKMQVLIFTYLIGMKSSSVFPVVYTNSIVPTINIPLNHRQKGSLKKSKADPTKQRRCRN